MGNLVTGLVLLGLAIVVVLAAILHFSVGGYDEDAPLERRLEPDAVEREDEEGTVIVTVGKGRELDAPPRPSESIEELTRRLDNELTPAQRALVDDRGFFPYTVQKGETLSGIAARFLGKSSLWTEIKQHNPEVRLPSDLREGMTIQIPLWLKR